MSATSTSFFQASSASRICSRERTPRWTYARGTSRHVFWHPQSRRGGAWVLCGLHAGHVRRITICFYRSSYKVHGISRTKEMLFQAGMFWVGRIFLCFTLVCIFKFIRRPRAASVESVKGLRQPANLPTDNSRPPIPIRCTV